MLDDQFVSAEESKTIKYVENILQIDTEIKNKIKKEIFSSAYLQVIEDKLLTKDEIIRITNLLAGLDIEDDLIRNEKDMFYDLVRAQEIVIPLPEIPKNKVPVNLKSNEKVYYCNEAKVLELKSSRKSEQVKSYELVREGMLIITDKRILMSNQGSTNIMLTDISYFEVDLDTRLIEITKFSSGKPVFLSVDSPFMLSKIIDLLL